MREPDEFETKATVVELPLYDDSYFPPDARYIKVPDTASGVSIVINGEIMTAQLVLEILLDKLVTLESLL